MTDAEKVKKLMDEKKNFYEKKVIFFLMWFNDQQKSVHDIKNYIEI